MGFYVVLVPMSLGLTFSLYGSLICPSLYFTWSHFRSVWVSMSLGIISVMYGSLCCPSFYVTCSHFRSVWVSMLSKLLCHLVSLPFCMGLYIVRLSMSLGLTSFLYGSLCCPSFHVTWSHFRSVWVSVFSVFLWHLVSLSICMGLYVVRVSMSLPFCIGLYVFRVSMSLGLTSIMYGSLCCSGFYVTWSHLCYIWVSMLSEFPCHLVSLPFYMGLYVVRVSMSLGFTFSMLSDFLYWFCSTFMFVIVLLM
jgi:hypothetical protein